MYITIITSNISLINIYITVVLNLSYVHTPKILPKCFFTHDYTTEMYPVNKLA